MSTQQTSKNPLVNKINAFRTDMGKTVKGYAYAKRALSLALATDGHVVLESVPGLAKTLMIMTMQGLIEGAIAARIQFTPDLKPHQVTGGRIFNPVTGKYEFEPGPIIGAHLVLADELNRTLPLTQSALLQPMQERYVDIPGVPRQMLNDPFMVLATINPVENEGTFDLPEAQLDRFMFKVNLGYAERHEEIEVLSTPILQTRRWAELLKPVISIEDIMKIREEVFNVNANASQSIKEYIVDLMRATRPQDKTFSKVKDAQGKTFEKRIAYGGSMRLGQWCQAGASAMAWLADREHIIPDDVKAVFPDCLRHRIIPTQLASFDPTFSPDMFVQAVMNAVPVVGVKATK